MYEYKALIISVYDGDTVTAVIDLGFSIAFKTKLRLLGIDTPEIRGSERPEGLISKARVVELIQDKHVTIVTEKDKTGKYGRYLADIYTEDGTHINALLLEEGLAEIYGK